MIKINQFFFELNLSTQKKNYHISQKRRQSKILDCLLFCDLYEALLLT